jgi:aryl-alcohol dehydrogenase-like predicted oxidoreductase
VALQVEYNLIERTPERELIRSANNERDEENQPN